MSLASTDGSDVIKCKKVERRSCEGPQCCVKTSVGCRVVKDTAALSSSVIRTYNT